MPDAIQPLWDFLVSPRTLGVLSGASVVMFVASLLGMPVLVARLPKDYFLRTGQDGPPSRIKSSSGRMAFRVGKNLIGFVLFLAGVAMLALPGQGLLTILVSVVLMDVPKKREFLLHIVRRPRVLAALNAIRRRAKRQPLEV